LLIRLRSLESPTWTAGRQSRLGSHLAQLVPARKLFPKIGAIAEGQDPLREATEAEKQDAKLRAEFLRLSEHPSKSEAEIAAMLRGQ
jgi:hypothetical protein